MPPGGLEDLSGAEIGSTPGPDRQSTPPPQTIDEDGWYGESVSIGPKAQLPSENWGNAQNSQQEQQYKSQHGPDSYQDQWPPEQRSEHANRRSRADTVRPTHEYMGNFQLRPARFSNVESPTTQGEQEKLVETAPARRTTSTLPQSATVTPPVNTIAVEDRAFTRAIRMPDIERYAGGPDERQKHRQFLRNMEWYFFEAGIVSDTHKIKAFRHHLVFDSDADRWFNTVELTKIATWDLLTREFNKWVEGNEDTQAEAERMKERILNHVIAEEDLLKLVRGQGDQEVHGYVRWAQQLNSWAPAISDVDGYLCTAVEEKLPLPVRQLIASKSFSTLSSLARVVRAIRPSLLRDLVEQSLATKRAAQQMNRAGRTTSGLGPASTVANLTQSLNKLTVNAPTTTGNPTRLAQGSTPALMSRPIQNTRTLPATRSTRPAADRYNDLVRNVAALPHHPDTPAGRSAYQQQLAAWLQANGRVEPNETRPFPLQPGTQDLNSNECWTCGQSHPGTRGKGCAIAANGGRVHPYETAWRKVAWEIGRDSGTAAVVTTSDDFEAWFLDPYGRSGNGHGHSA